MIPHIMMLRNAALRAEAPAADMSSRMTMRPAVGGRIGVFFLMYETRIQEAHFKLKLSYRGPGQARPANPLTTPCQ